MRRWMFNTLCILMALLSGIFLFLLKYQVIEKEEQLGKIQKQILSDKREIHMLKADWTLLNDPERLRALVAAHTNFKPIKPDQIIEMDILPNKPAPAPERKPTFAEEEV